MSLPDRVQCMRISSIDVTVDVDHDSMVMLKCKLLLAIADVSPDVPRKS